MPVSDLISVALSSLLLPVGGDSEKADAAIEEVRRHDPLLAARLELSRRFGLTKVEALSVDPVSGMRPWGLVVEKNPFVAKVRLSEPRVVPAISGVALQCLEAVARTFRAERSTRPASEGPMRVRVLQQRRVFHRLSLDDEWFFANVTSHQREAIRIGTKWAQRQQESLQMALAA